MHEGLSALGARDWGDRDTVALKGRILAAVRDVAQGVEQSSLGEDFRNEVIEALHRIPELLETWPVPPGGYVSAVHGDLHLGQILRQGDRCVIIDFEGEPLASVEERLAWHSPLKDVAGMIRSFDYAAGFAEQHAPQGRKTEFADWRDRMERTFLSEYGEFPVENGGHPRYPDALLSLYLIEKVLYEMKYELSSRPDWFGIPYSGLKRMIYDIRGDGLRSWKI
jgi:maltose alpha-D-glucosyltransferase/alpha-amylase